MLYPVVKITFVKKDAPLALKIQEVIQGGTLEYPKNSSYVNLLFQDLNSTQMIAMLLNGNMRTPKIDFGILFDRLTKLKPAYKKINNT